MSRYHLQFAYLRDGWAEGVVVDVSDRGFITAAVSTRAEAPPEAEAPAHGALQARSARLTSDAERVLGYVIPGMSNGHSHAFQRAMAGKTEFRLSERDSFWTWRNAMYALANRIDPAELRVIATQLFVEMLKCGYTSVAEFHYLHLRQDGGSFAGANELWEAIVAAAATAGIGLTLLPTLYQSSDFGGRAPKPEQARFLLDTETFLRGIEARIGAERRAGSTLVRTGAAFHSLRAVPLQTLREAALGLRAIDPAMPVHIHVAEQALEVQACLAATGRRPIELLLDTGLLTERWCLVHATHATHSELDAVAASGASVCVSVSTEANLGDGFFDTAHFLRAGGRFCVGSDSQATVNPAEELRWLEYQQRLRDQRRGLLAEAGEPHVGTRLWRDAARNGARAIGQPAGTIEVGQRADWLVLDSAHASLAGAAADSVFDHLVFAGADAAIRDVMVGGRWAVKARRHVAEEESAARFGELMRKLAG